MGRGVMVEASWTLDTQPEGRVGAHHVSRVLISEYPNLPRAPQSGRGSKGGSRQVLQKNYGCGSLYLPGGLDTFRSNTPRPRPARHGSAIRNCQGTCVIA